MNRRKLFGFLAATPFVGAAVREAVAAPDTASPPFGLMRIVYEARRAYALGPVTDPGHTHPYYGGIASTHTVGLVGTTESVPRQEIFDGKHFVRMDSPEGAAVFNKLMGERA